MEPGNESRVTKALNAMESLGISPKTVKPVLKRLLKLYNRNWELIEEDNFRTLADAIFENADDELMEEKERDTIHEQDERPLKKQNRGLLKDEGLCKGGNEGKVETEKQKQDTVPKTSSGTRVVDSSPVSRNSVREPHHRSSKSKHKDLIQPNPAPGEEKPSTRPGTENKNVTVPRKKQPAENSPLPIDPVSCAHPGSKDSSPHSATRNKINESNSGHNHQTMNQTTYDIASSTNGHVKVSLQCNNALQQHSFHTLSAEEFLRFAERQCQKLCPTPGNQFSVVNLLNELCESFFETFANRSPMKRRLSRNDVHCPLGSGDDVGRDHTDGHMGKRVSDSSRSSDSRSLAIVEEQHERNNDKKRVLRKIGDITRGTENVMISLIDERGTDEPPPNFFYCSENVTYESAYVHVSLARISDEDCCRRCKGDCLSSNLTCACARDTGGEYAYTPDGLLTEKFLKSCIAMKLEPREQDLFYCQNCPNERAKHGGAVEKCKGHLMRKFIKECWRKCGCTMKCGNRVVQRGITKKLQVFLTSEGKGWGLRTLEDLPEGAFVCEYVGEILTNIELYERNEKSARNKRHAYPVLLDADWATEGILKDEDALCLDATYYGNIGRFINHRCFDGNIIEVPVQVETPDRHYYHLAFFAKRKVNAFEELTWDYGIDFDDETHPIEAFRCECGSGYCRGTKKPQH